jgi:hypothetical protein
LFVTHIIDELHFEVLLQWCYLSEIFTTSYITAGNFKFVLSKISHSQLYYWPRQKNMGITFWATLILSTGFYRKLSQFLLIVVAVIKLHASGKNMAII